MAVLAAAALAMPACAQTSGGPTTGAPGAGPMAGVPAAAPMAGGPMGGERLHLTPDQRQKIQPIMKSSFDQMRSIVQDAHGREMAALSADHRAKVQQIIDQAKAAMPSEMPSHMPPGGPNGASPPHNGPMSAIRAQHRQFISQIDAVLTPGESQAVDAIGRDARTKVVALHQSAINQIKPLLNADQAKTLDQMPMRGHMGVGRNHAEDAGGYLLMGAMAHMRPEMHP